MGAIGGSIESVSIKGRLFAVTADANVDRKLGGFEGDVESNGNGSGRKIMIRVPWELPGLVLEIDDSLGDQEFLQDVSDMAGYVTCLITYVSGISYEGQGTITGELQGSSEKATGSITLKGPGKLSSQL